MNLLSLLPLLSAALAAPDSSYSHKYCTSSESCWPSRQTWSAFNRTISGRLISPHPIAHPCHDPNYSAALCQTAKSNWTSSFFRTSQPGGYAAILWELGEDQCFINSTRQEPCEQGLVSTYAVNVGSAEDVVKTIKFAEREKIRLVVKNTGHDHLGRSSAKGSLAIWTHNLKGRVWHDGFRAKGAPRGERGVKAVTLAAGEQWLDVYRDAATHGAIVVGGSARTVGSAGGYMTGGGHSAWSHFYGLAVDNLLQVEIVTPSGQTKTLNKYTDPDYFWAVRGGGGNSWGVITSATYKTHPEPSHIQVALVQVNATNPAAHRAVLSKAFPILAHVTDAGYTGYGVLGGGFSAIFIQPNATNATFNAAFAPFQDMKHIPGASPMMINLNFPTWMDYGNQFLQDPNIATNVIDTSRLLTAKVLREKNEELAELVLSTEGVYGGFNFIGKVNSKERDNTAAHPIWKEGRTVFSMGVDWPDDAPDAEKKRKKRLAVEMSRRLEKIVGKNGGTYVNEANPYEPDWKNVFWGPKYERLLKIKRRIDPKNLLQCNRCVGSEIVYEP